MSKDSNIIEKEVLDFYVLDTRRAKANKKFPVKLRVFTPQPRKQKLYPTRFEFTINEFDSIWNTTKPRDEHKPIRKQIEIVRDRAEEAWQVKLALSISNNLKNYCTGRKEKGIMYFISMNRLFRN